MLPTPRVKLYLHRLSHVLVHMPDFGEPRTLMRVRHASRDKFRLHLEWRNGQIATVDASAPLDFKPGDVVLVDTDSGDIDKAPKDLWPDDGKWIGTVKEVLGKRAVVQQGSQLRMVTNKFSDDPVEVGNTVEVSDLKGILRRISDRDLNSINIGDIEPIDISPYKSRQSQEHSFDDFGGMQHIVARARELIELPLMHHERLNKIGARPVKGVLFTGGPGTGKTMLAKIIAAQSGATFYEVSGPEIFSKWYGNSERLLRELFADAAGQQRSIIFFDEIDSIAADRGSDTHEASKRVVAQLLTLMDGSTSKDNVIVIATTNRPQDIDRALRRPGRFDWVIDFGKPDLEDRLAILQTIARTKEVAPNLDHSTLARLTDGWNSSELAAIFSESALLAVKDKRASIANEDYFGGFERVQAQHLINQELS